MLTPIHTQGTHTRAGTQPHMHEHALTRMIPQSPEAQQLCSNKLGCQERFCVSLIWYLKDLTQPTCSFSRFNRSDRHSKYLFSVWFFKVLNDSPSKTRLTISTSLIIGSQASILPLRLHTRVIQACYGRLDSLLTFVSTREFFARLHVWFINTYELYVNNAK